METDTKLIIAIISACLILLIIGLYGAFSIREKAYEKCLSLVQGQVQQCENIINNTK